MADITDAQFSTRALLGWGGMLVERNTFSAYGLARHHRRGDVNGDGAVDAGDTALIDSILGATIDPAGTGGYRVEADLNRDGKISLTDRTMVGVWGRRETYAEPEQRESQRVVRGKLGKVVSGLARGLGRTVGRGPATLCSC
jgi:hypothetical protein